MAARFASNKHNNERKRKFKQHTNVVDADINALNSSDESQEDVTDHLPTPKKHLKNINDKRLIVILEGASLETVFTKKGGYQLLTSDKHHTLLSNEGRDPTLARPDITHQCLLMLLDSPLNQAGLLQIYIHTERNVLIQVSPQTRIPRTFDRFCGVIVQLLRKLVVRAAGDNRGNVLLKIIKNPISDHLPIGCLKVGTSYHAEKLVDPSIYTNSENPVAIIIGAFSKGSLGDRKVDYTEEMIAISHYPLSAAFTCSLFCTKFAESWNVESTPEI